MSDRYIETSPQHLSVLCVLRAERTMRLTLCDPTQWFLVIPDLHRALSCALVAALQGTAGIGAYGPKLRQRWLEYLEATRTNREVLPPDGDKVESFTELLQRVQVPSPELRGDPLLLTAQQLEDLHKLNVLRGDIEHVKPASWFLEVAGLPRICRAAAYALGHLYNLPPLFIHLEEPELESGRRAVENILNFNFQTKA